MNQFITQQNYSNQAQPAQPATTVAQQQPKLKKQDSQERKYIALRIIGMIYKVIGWLIIVAGGLFTIIFNIAGGAGYAMSNSPLRATGGFAAIVFISMGFIIFGLLGIGFLALSESIYLVIDIEDNTRVKASQQT